MSDTDRLSDWPALDELPRLAAFLDRLGRLPVRVGSVDLGVIRDVALPMPGDWPDDVLPASLPDRVEASWLATAWRMRPMEESAPERLLHIAREVRTRPDWSLTAIWLLESALGWPEPRPPLLHGALLGEVGDLYCQTGNVVLGVELLDAAQEALALSGDHAAGQDARELALRAACWIVRVNERSEDHRLRQLADPEQRASVGVRLYAELELLGLSIGRRVEATALFEHVRQVEMLLARAEAVALQPRERSRLRIRAGQLVGRWMGASRSRQVRQKGCEHLTNAMAECVRIEDFVDLSLTQDTLARSLLRQGAMVQAREVFQESVTLKQRLRDLWGLGTSLTGLAECYLAVGQARESLPFFEVNLLLLDRLPGLDVLFVRNLARHLNALVAAECNPLDQNAPDPHTLALAAELLRRTMQLSRQPGEDPFCQLLSGNYHRLAARSKTDPLERLLLLEEGINTVDDARERFDQLNNLPRAIEARRALAALYLERAAIAEQPEEDLEEARGCLEQAEHTTLSDQGRFETELLWARYHQLAGAPSRMQMHLAAARRAAEATGLSALTLEVDARLGVNLIGPGGEASVIVIQPGEVTDLLVQAEDWRGRPLPGFALQATVEPVRGAAPAITPARIRTDGQGRAMFSLRAATAGEANLRIGTPDGIHVLANTVVVRRLEIERESGIEPHSHPNDEALLRQLFGRDCPRLRVLRDFSSGHSGARVLLVEPFRDGEGGAELRGQPCIVKLGPRRALEDEQLRYVRWVKELLPVNVSRLDGLAAWHDRAALRFSLVGEGRGGALAHGQVREASEWLAAAAPFEAHLLLERVFVGDLAACWYGNSPRQREPTSVAELYAPYLPPLLYLEETGPGLGLTSVDAVPQASACVSPVEGLRSPDQRSSRLAGEVLPGAARLRRFRQAGERWEYDFITAAPPLRFTFHSSLSPELLDPDGAAERLVAGQGSGWNWQVIGQVRETIFDRLRLALDRCCAAYSAMHPGEQITHLAERLVVRSLGVSRNYTSPLGRLAELLGSQIPCHWSLIHGDLHGRNVLVSPRGEPFYIDFAWTGYGPTLYDFLKFEVYLWHENYAPAEGAWANLASAIRVLDDLAGADAGRQFPSPYGRHGPSDLAPLATFRQCLATLRSAARPYVVTPGARDYFAPLALYTGLMLRWCDPEEARGEADRRRRARQGVIHALACAAMLDGALGIHHEK